MENDFQNAMEKFSAKFRNTLGECCVNRAYLKLR